MILDKILKFFIILLAAVSGAALMRLASPYLAQFVSTEILKTDMGFFRLTLWGLIIILVGLIIGGMVGSLLAPFFISQLKRFSAWAETQVNKMPVVESLFGVFGLALGLIIANLLGNSFARIPIIGDYAPVIFSLVFGYLGIRLLTQKRREIAAVFDAIPRLLRELVKQKEEASTEKAVSTPNTAEISENNMAPADNFFQSAPAAMQPENLPFIVPAGANYKLLDTNVIIDGRIADIIDSGFLEGTVVVPVFVLEELQHIADSSDALKRGRGRRGLDILQQIRTAGKIKVEVMNRDFDDIAEVDSKLVRLGQILGGKIITNDYNLNKVSELRGVSVLNINELANAVKPVVIPGESLEVTIVKDGKESGQGVAYLDDGTMIVVENGRRHLNSTITVEVTSALQTAAGRMIFARARRP